MDQLPPERLEAIVTAALDEDLARAGDRTTEAVVSAGATATARIVARSRLVVAGIPVARAVFRALEPGLRFDALVHDGTAVDPGTAVVRVRGAARPILVGERTALNFLMRMSGIATATRSAVAEVAGTGTTILDTRKTAPCLRLLDKYAVAAGGGTNHRMGLYDAVMIKDTHLGLGITIAEAVAAALGGGTDPEHVTVEVRSLDELAQAIDAGAGRALLDNMEPAQMREAVRLAAGRIVLEASGGLRPGRLRPVAETGVDCLSLGWLTHSAPAADLAMELDRAVRG